MKSWVLILGGSTGHGAATAIKLAEKGYGIISFHFDRGEAKKIANQTIDKVNKITGMDITFVTSAESDDEALALLNEFGLPFKNK